MKVAVIGAGAAGMMAAATIQELAPEVQVVLIEKNRGLGKKVLISGGGRCNVTTGIHNVRELLTKYERGSKFLNSAMYNFPPDKVYEWFQERGVELKTEPDMRVFPVSNNGQDVVGVFEELFSGEHEQLGRVDVMLRNPAKHIEYKNEEEYPYYVVTLKSGEEIMADKVVITTGGEAYRHTGSTGDGYTFAEQFGHSITPLAASLNSFITQESWPGTLAGVSFQNVQFSIPKTAIKHSDPKKSYTATGPMVFTHEGITGPAPFALAAKIAFEVYSSHEPLPMQMNFIPGTTYDALLQQINTDCNQQPTVLIRKYLQTWLPKSVITVLLQEVDLASAITDDKSTLANFNKSARQAVAKWLTQCTVQLVGRGSGSEFVTAGGVLLTEVNPKTMESKIQPGLYFAGEILNIDGVTGGFNLQASWAAGRLVGQHISTIVAS